MNLFERIISVISPSAAFRRERARMAFNEIKKFNRKYEGASRGKRLSGWTAPSSSANQEIRSGGQTLRDRARDLVRNNAWAESGLNAVVTETVGEGIVPTAFSLNKADKKKVDAANSLWIRWGESVYCDFDRNHDIYGLQDLIFRTVVESGEALVHKVIDVGNPILPLRIRVLEPDFLDTNKNENLVGGGKIVNGIEYDKSANRVAYWLFEEHPFDDGNCSFSKSLNSKRVDAKDIRHVFDPKRAHQNRGVTWFHSIIVKFRTWDETEDAKLMQQKIAACFAGFITKPDEAPDATASEIEGTIQPGTMQVLSSGESVSFANPPSIEGFKDMFLITMLAVAAGLGITYEVLTGDFSNVNFSSGRLGWIKMFKNVKRWRQKILIPQVLNPIWVWFTEAATISVVNIEGIGANWTPPRREMIDPAKETEATQTEIRAGLKTLSEAIRERGFDPMEVFTERANELKQLDDLKIDTASDPRKDKGKFDNSMQGGNNANSQN